MQIQIDNLTRNQDNLNKNLQGLNRQYQSVVSKLVNFQHTISAHDNFMQNIIQYMANPEPSRELFLAPAQAQKLISSYDEAAKASVDIMNELSQMGAHMAMAAQGSAAGALPPPPQQQSHPTYAPTISSSYSGTPEVVKAEYQSPTRDTFTSPATSPDSQSLPNGSAPIEPSSVFNNFQFPTTDQPSGDSQHTGGLRVFTTGYFAPRQDDDQLESENNNPVAQPPPNMPIVKEHDEEGPPQQSLRVRRQTFVPGWAVPPKILLVDDDAVIRNLSSKFLQVFGCEADIAVDGLSALDKVNMEKYDLILMDVVMPNLDGITTTNYIRQYDTKTPIISMTSNTFPDDILNYRNSGTHHPSLLTQILMAGMSDILPKPFTKDSLLGMLEKHLTHMKHMQELGGYVIPAPIKSDRLVELPEQQNPTSQQPQQQQQKQQRQQQQESMPLGTPLDEERPFQFSYDQDYSAIFGNGSTPTQLPPQQQNIPASTGKRRTVSERDQYEYVEQGRSVPRSTGGGGSAPGKRVRYNTPPW